MLGTLLTHSLKSLTLVVAATVTATAALAGLVPEAFSPVRVEIESGQDLEGLIAQIGAADPHTRAMAACRIGRLRGANVDAARDALLSLLGDDAAVEPRLCRDYDNWGDDRQSSPGREAAIALERVGSAAIDPLISMLGQGGAVERENAAFALGLIEQAQAIDALSAALDDEVAGVRARAAWSLGMIEDAAAVPGLERALVDPVVRVREQAAWAMGMIEDGSAVPALGRALEDSAPAVREQVAWALGMIEDRTGVVALVTALDDEVADVREQAAWALGMIEDGSAVDGLLEAIEDEDAGVRKQALWALMRCIEDVDDADLDYEELAARLRRALRSGGSQ